MVKEVGVDWIASVLAERAQSECARSMRAIEVNPVNPNGMEKGIRK
jgi:hypothetical protein